MTRYFVGVDGEYLGGFDGAVPPAGALEVVTPPAHAGDRWDGAQWVEGGARRRAEILRGLLLIDEKSIRALREGDAARVAGLESQAQGLRLELAALVV